MTSFKTLKIVSSLNLLIVLLSFSACSYDSESDLVETFNQTEPISYQNNIQAIINNNCVGCHSSPPQNGAPFPLTTYENVFLRAENGQLLNTISRQTGEPNAMPPSGRMAQTTIDLIQQWIEEGLLE